LRVNAAQYDVTVEAIERVIDVQGLGHSQGQAVERNGVAIVRLRSRARMALDTYATNQRTGRGVLVDGYRVVGGCVIEQALAVQTNIVAVRATVDMHERAAANGHRGGVLWLTGLSGAGKSTLAMALLRRLFARGRQVYVLDGDNLRGGLNGDLGFSADDRSENIRRTAEVARLFADAGFVVIVSLISPLAADRENARRICGKGFHEVFVKADLATCRARDPKRLYARAEAGEIAQFTGVSAPYEAPASADLTIDTGACDVEAAVEALERFAEAAFAGRAEERRLAG
jgi:bifunctional enzyme CysN/CysC